MDESGEKSSEPPVGQDAGNAKAGNARTGRRKVLWLVVGIVLVLTVLKFFGSVRPSDSSRGVVSTFAEDMLAPETPEPALPASPLDFLTGQTSQRPATVETLLEEARRVTECLADGFPNLPGVYDMAARVHNKGGDWREAERQWERAIELNADYGYAYLGLAALAAQEGKNERVVSLLRRALIISPNSFDAQIQLAQALIDLNRMEEAIRLLQQNVVSDPRAYRGRVLLGMAHLQLEEYEKAKENYEAAIAAHPKHANAHFGLATAYARLGRRELHEEYIAKFQELRAGEREIAAAQRRRFDDLGSMRADVAQIYTDAAKICFSQGWPRETEILCSRAAVLDPANTDCRQALARIYLNAGKHADVIGIFEELSTIEPDNLGYPLEIARLYATMGDFSAAEETLEKVCEKAPESAVGYVALANLFLWQSRRLPEAVKMAQTAARLVPNVPNYLLLSSACEQSGAIPDALEAMAAVVKLAPDNLPYQQMYELLKEKQSQSSAP